MANKIILCQTGAIHRYLIPKVLEDSKMLYRLYTDSTVYSTLGKLSLFINRCIKCPPINQRLAKRIPPNVYTQYRVFVCKALHGLCDNLHIQLQSI